MSWDMSPLHSSLDYYLPWSPRWDGMWPERIYPNGCTWRRTPGSRTKVVHPPTTVGFAGIRMTSDPNRGNRGCILGKHIYFHCPCREPQLSRNLPVNRDVNWKMINSTRYMESTRLVLVICNIHLGCSFCQQLWIQLSYGRSVLSFCFVPLPWLIFV